MLADELHGRFTFWVAVAVSIVIVIAWVVAK
jgi:hypothetical protein